MSISHSPLYRSPPGPRRLRASATPAPHIIPWCPRRHNGRRTVTISASGEREKSLPQAEKGGGKTLVKSKGKTISHRPSNPASNTDQPKRVYRSIVLFNGVAVCRSSSSLKQINGRFFFFFFFSKFLLLVCTRYLPLSGCRGGEVSNAGSVAAIQSNLGCLGRLSYHKKWSIRTATQRVVRRARSTILLYFVR